MLVKEVPMPKVSHQLEQLELYHHHWRIPEWKTLPETVRNEVLADLTRMFRDRLERIAVDQEQGGSRDE
jgi:hypothetical protein